MRVCDVTKNDEVATRYVIVEFPLTGNLDAINGIDTGDGNPRVVHDLEVGKEAATSIEKLDWKALHSMTPFRDRPSSADRSAAARQAAVTRKANKEAAAAATAGAGAPGGVGGATAPGAKAGAAQGHTAGATTGQEG